jgi:hypothetical protein
VKTVKPGQPIYVVGDRNKMEKTPAFWEKNPFLWDQLVSSFAGADVLSMFEFNAD